MKNYKNKRTNGIALVLVIITIGLIGIVMLFLSSASNSMMFQANDFYLQACERNLISSGRNWAKTNLKKETFTNFNNTIQLDVNDMNILGSSLELKITNTQNGQNEVQINTICNRGRLNHKSDTSFIVPDYNSVELVSSNQRL